MATIRDSGIAMLAIEKPVKARLVRLAGDTPIYIKVRELVDMAERLEGGGSGVPLPGQERLVSENTLPALSFKMNKMMAKLEAMDKAFFSVIMPGSQPVTGGYTPAMLEADMKALLDKAKQFGITQQGELKLAGG